MTDVAYTVVALWLIAVFIVRISPDPPNRSL